MMLESLTQAFQRGASIPDLAPHDHAPLMSSSVTPWVISTCTHSHENQSRVQRGDAPTHSEGHPSPLQEPMEEYPPEYQMKKQVRFNMGDDLGDDATLPTNLTTLLAGSTAEKWDDAPSPSTPLPVDASQLPLSESH